MPQPRVGRRAAAGAGSGRCRRASVRAGRCTRVSRRRSSRRSRRTSSASTIRPPSATATKRTPAAPARSAGAARRLRRRGRRACRDAAAPRCRLPAAPPPKPDSVARGAAPARRSGAPLDPALSAPAAATTPRARRGPGERELRFRVRKGVVGRNPRPQRQSDFLEVESRGQRRARRAATPPLKLVVGNARGVRLTYDDQAGRSRAAHRRDRRAPDAAMKCLPEYGPAPRRASAAVDIGARRASAAARRSSCSR